MKTQQTGKPILDALLNASESFEDDKPTQTETGTHSQEIVVDPKVFDQAHGLREIEPRRYDLELKYVERAERAEAHAERLAEALKIAQRFIAKLEKLDVVEVNSNSGLDWDTRFIIREALAQWEQQT